jgi:spore germination protein YaaH
LNWLTGVEMRISSIPGAFAAFSWLLAACSTSATAVPADRLSATPTSTTSIPDVSPTNAQNLSPTPKTSATSAPSVWCDTMLAMDDDFLIVGYLPEYRDFEPSWGSCLTDLIYFSAEPDEDGRLDTWRVNPERQQAMREVKQTYGTRLHLSIGGYERSEHFIEVIADRQSRRNFVEDVVQFCEANDLDGVDFDWEFPEGEFQILRYVSLISDVRQRGLIVSVALYPHADIDFKAFADIDRIHIMSYDYGSRHSTFEQAVEDLALFEQAGFSRQQLILGIPFYGSRTTYPNTSSAYAEIIELYDPGVGIDEIEGIYFNDVLTVKHKTCYAHENGYGGVMIWELGQDSSGKHSLLRAIHQAVATGCGP